MPSTSLAAPIDAARAFTARLGMRPWRLIHTDPAPGAWNMAVDALLLAAAEGGADPALRLYAWEPPAVSLGRFQRPDAGIRWEEVRRRGWGAVRRPTGGRAVLHQHELTYAVILPPDVVAGVGVRPAYAALAEGLRAALHRLVGRSAAIGCGPGAPARSAPANCFARATGADCTAGDGKVIGSAQVRSRGALLQHGSLLLDVDRDAWRALFGDEGVLRSLRELAGAAVPFAVAAEALIAAFRATWGIALHPAPLSRAEHAAAERAAAHWSLGG